MRYFPGTLTLFIFLLGTIPLRSAILEESDYFQFHSNFWINLHHFLYQQAKGDQQLHLQEDEYTLTNIGDTQIVAALKEADRKIFQQAVHYYSTYLIDKSLLFDLANHRQWLQKQKEDSPITDTSFGARYTEILNRTAPVYRKNFWNLHHQQNSKILEKHFKIIQNIEAESIRTLEKMAGADWPAGKIRVDLTAYGNWAGAYTQSQPDFNITISSLDPFSLQPAFIETVFHEASHILFTRESKLRAKIFFMSNEMDVKFPRNLWHAAQFYLCGRLIQDKLKEFNIEYVLMMDIKHIFAQSNTPPFRSALEKYYQGDADLENTVRALLLIHQ